MPGAATVRAQVEAALADRIPSALRIAAREVRPTASTGVRSVDGILGGGLPVGAITEIVGAECCGRTSFSLSFLACITKAGKVGAWIDVSNALQPESAAAAGVELSRMLWVRCGAGGRTLKQGPPAKPWSRIDQALRVADLLLQGGGFGAIVLDMAGIDPEQSSRVPLATWFRYRAAAEKSQTSVLLLTQHACAKSSAGLVLQLRPGSIDRQQTVFTGIEHRTEVVRQRFNSGECGNIIPLRKPPQRATSAAWQARTVWAGRA